MFWWKGFLNETSWIENEFLLPQNYHLKVIDSQFNKVRILPGGTFKERRLLALKKKSVEIVQDDQKKRVIAPIDFNPLLPKMSDVFCKHFKAILFKKPGAQGNPPMAAYRQTPNLRKKAL